MIEHHIVPQNGTLNVKKPMSMIVCFVLEKVCEEKEIEVAKHVCEENGDSDTE